MEQAGDERFGNVVANDSIGKRSAVVLREVAAERLAVQALLGNLRLQGKTHHQREVGPVERIALGELELLPSLEWLVVRGILRSAMIWNDAKNTFVHP